MNLTQIHCNRDYITSDAFLELSKNLGFTYYKRDFLFKGGTWRGQEISPLALSALRDSNLGLVLGHSDALTSGSILRFLRFVGYDHIWGTNTRPIKNFASPIPLGLVNDCDDSSFHRIMGNQEDLQKAFESSDAQSDFKGSFYVNFTTANNFKERSHLLRILKSTNSVKYAEMDISRAGRLRYLSELPLSSFVLCPEGNGIDTHRLWETLYMGGVAVVKSNSCINELVKDLPVVIVRKWSDILNTPLMEAKWYEAHEKYLNLNLLTMSHWRHKLFLNVKESGPS